MPIYAYKCATCGHEKDVLQKISDAPLTVCPACGADTFNKQVTAAGFQLKGSGWYVTDFRDGGKKEGSAAPKTEPKAADSKDSASNTAAAAPSSASDSASASTPSPTPAPPPPPPSSSSSSSSSN